MVRDHPVFVIVVYVVKSSFLKNHTWRYSLVSAILSEVTLASDLQYLHRWFWQQQSCPNQKMSSNDIACCVNFYELPLGSYYITFIAGFNN
jgi:hypothetical protein